MDNLDAGIAGKVVFVEGENGCDAMDPRRCHEPCIVRRFAGDAVLDDKAFP
jgi:hypothetical protein